MKAWFVFFCACLSLGCQFRPPQKPSVIVVAVEGLDFESVPCVPGDIEDSGFSELCRESVRFTHAYTPSVLSQPALASILSARYPHEHKVRNNGSNYLSEKINTLPEVALQSGYRTLFVSGGPPIWRKSGFSQGFEIFEDNIGVDLGRYYRPARENFSIVTDWLTKLRRGEPYFVMTYLADLQFPFTVTKTDVGNERSQTRESQLKEIEERVSAFVHFLKKSNRWDQTYFVLVGLNGTNRRQAFQRISALNLFSENSHVSLLIKPARAQRDQGIEWSVDVNVSLVDLGATLFNIFGANDLSYLERSLGVVSFYSSLERPSISWHRERVLLVESDWAAWRGIGSTRTSLRKEQWLMIYDQVPKIYNTLVDRYEVNPMSSRDLGASGVMDSFNDIIKTNNIEAWSSPPDDILQKVNIAKVWFAEKKLNKEASESLLHLIRTRPWDQQIIGWGALYAIEEKNWDMLLDLAEANSKPIWKYIALRMKGESPEPPVDACFSLLIGAESADRESNCKDRLFTLYSHWSHEKDEVTKVNYAKRFLSTLYFRDIQREIAWHNYLNGLSWDTILTLPGEPDLLDLVLLLPEYRKPK